MAILCLAIVFSLVMCALALRANARYRAEGRLPMQWWLNGEVTWYAPRPFALALIPMLAVCVFACVALLSLNVRPRPGQEGMLLPSFIIIGAIFLGTQLFHLWMVEKTLHRNGG